MKPSAAACSGYDDLNSAEGEQMASPVLSAANPPNLTFAYEAQTHTGEPIRGTIDAPALTAAELTIKSMGLRLIQLNVVEESRPGRPLNNADFSAFNHQLAQIAAAGLPMEQSLRLIAADLRAGRLKQTIDSIAAGLEQGQSLEAVFAVHRNQFSPLYAGVVEAGIRSSNLSAVLINLGRQMDTLRRLRDELIRAIAYPLMVLLAVGLLVIFLSHYVFPQIAAAYLGFQGNPMPTWSSSGGFAMVPQPPLPLVTRVIGVSGPIVGPALVVISLVLLAIPLLWTLAPGSGLTQAMDAMLFHVPLVGPVLKKGTIARWLGGLSVAVAAGMDLPGAIALANGAAGSAPLTADGNSLIEAMQAGGQMSDSRAFRLLPASIPPTLDVAARTGHLPETVAALAASYQEQADLRIAVIPSILTPLLMTVVAVIIGALILALLAPLSQLMSWIGHP